LGLFWRFSRRWEGLAGGPGDALGVREGCQIAIDGKIAEDTAVNLRRLGVESTTLADDLLSRTNAPTGHPTGCAVLLKARALCTRAAKND